MPTILRLNGYRFYFYSDEEDRPHIHVEYESRTAKFWIKPVTLSKNEGLNASELSKAHKLTIKNENLFMEKWNEYFSKKS